MGRAGTIARRTFLAGSAAILGGVAFGTYLVSRPLANPLEDGLGPNEAALTPFVLVREDGITLITPRADVGQGVRHLQAMLIAEELDVTLDQVTLDPGTPAAAYYNSAIIAEGLPFAPSDGRLVADAARSLGDPLGRILKLQITGGSSTTPDMDERLRMAGAVARETLKAAAAQRAGVPVDEVTTEAGRVLLPDGTAIPYTELAAEAAGITPPASVPLRDPSQWRLIGTPTLRSDMVAKSTGRQAYGIDLAMDGMVHATVRTNPAQGGGMLSYDARAAEGMRGIHQILEIEGGIAVVADNTWRAMRAAEAVEIAWGTPDYPADTGALFHAIAASFTEENRDSRPLDVGDVEAAIEAAGGRAVTAEYRVPFLNHAPLEPMSCLVLYGADRLDIWTSTQIPRFVQAKVERLWGIPADEVHIHDLYGGGSFGRRLEDDYVQQAVEIARAMPGTPVKLTWSREEDMTHGFYRPGSIARARGTVAGGHVESYDLAIASPSVAASQGARLGQSVPGADGQITAGTWQTPYAIPNRRITGYRTPPLTGVSSWRSVGASGNGFVHEGFLDELIHAADADPLEERLRLCWHRPTRRVLERVGEMCGWSGPRPGSGVGRGVALVTSFGVPVAEVVEVRDTGAGLKVETVWAALDCGRIVDPVNWENQVQGGILWGLGHAMFCEMTYRDHAPEQTNYDSYPSLRLYQTPRIVIDHVDNGSDIRGVGEPPVPPAAPALGNAIFAATGQRIREMPFARHVDFV